MPTQRRAKLATAAGVAAAALTLATGLAVAAGLPDHASDTATEHVADQATTTSTTSSTTSTTVASHDDETTAPKADTNSEPQNDNEGQANRPTDTHGYAVSQLATTTDAQGRAKGEAISTLAKSNAQNDSHAAPDTTGAATADDHADEHADDQPATHGKSADHTPDTADSND